MTKAQLDDGLAQLTESGLAFRRGTIPQSVYTFKHGLVQDVACDSLLKSRRQELHEKIARVIEAQFPTLKDAEPELLAHHYTEAGLAEAAITYWQEASQRAARRSAHIAPPVRKPAKWSARTSSKSLWIPPLKFANICISMFRPSAATSNE